MSLSIALLYGGVSSERDVSLESGKCVFEALKKNFDKIQLIDVNQNFSEEIIKINADIFFFFFFRVSGEHVYLQ